MAEQVKVPVKAGEKPFAKPAAVSKSVAAMTDKIVADTEKELSTEKPLTEGEQKVQKEFIKNIEKANEKKEKEALIKRSIYISPKAEEAFEMAYLQYKMAAVGRKDDDILTKNEFMEQGIYLLAEKHSGRKE